MANIDQQIPHDAPPTMQTRHHGTQCYIDDLAVRESLYASTENHESLRLRQ